MGRLEWGIWEWMFDHLLVIRVNVHNGFDNARIIKQGPEAISKYVFLKYLFQTGYLVE